MCSKRALAFCGRWLSSLHALQIEVTVAETFGSQPARAGSIVTVHDTAAPGGAELNAVNSQTARAFLCRKYITVR